MLCPIAFGNARGKRGLVLNRAAELLEGKRNGADLLLACVAHEAKKRSGVDARGEKEANLDICEQMSPHALERRHQSRRVSC